MTRSVETIEDRWARVMATMRCRALWSMSAALTMASCTTGQGPGSGGSALEGTRWQLEVLRSMSDEQPPGRPIDPLRYTLSFEASGQARLLLDCNRAQGEWKAQPSPDSSPSRRSGSLTFGPLASTRAACPPDSLAPRLARELPYVRSYVIENGRLHLSLAADGGIQTWAPMRTPSP